jgi:hypothetical protein
MRLMQSEMIESLSMKTGRKKKVATPEQYSSKILWKSKFSVPGERLESPQMWYSGCPIGDVEYVDELLISQEEYVLC